MDEAREDVSLETVRGGEVPGRNVVTVFSRVVMNLCHA